MYKNKRHHMNKKIKTNIFKLKNILHREKNCIHWFHKQKIINKWKNSHIHNLTNKLQKKIINWLA